MNLSENKHPENSPLDTKFEIALKCVELGELSNDEIAFVTGLTLAEVDKIKQIYMKSVEPDLRELMDKDSYTLSDYLAKYEYNSIQIYDGAAYNVPPPKRLHQKICLAIAVQLYNYLEDKTPEVYVNPFTVRPYKQKDYTPDKVDTVISPDISVVCDLSKLDEYGCKGAPEFVIEVAAPETSEYDDPIKYNILTDSDTLEYWVVYPEAQIVTVYSRTDTDVFFSSKRYTFNDKIKVNIFDDLYIDMTRMPLN